MSSESPRAIAVAAIKRVVSARGLVVPDLIDDTRVLGGELSIDSLDLATVVVELQTRTSRDPFAGGFVPFETLGQLVKLFEAPEK